MVSKNPPAVPRRRYTDFCNKIGAKRTVVRSATCGVARSHLDRHLAVLAEIRLFAGQPGLVVYLGALVRLEAVTTA